MNSQYSIFGADLKEPPQLTMARTILGVSRNATREEIKKVYRTLAPKLHPDNNPGKHKEELAEKFKSVSISYKLLTDDQKREEAAKEFKEALEQPFFVGERLFCVGSLYGVRIYVPDECAAITDTRRLIGGGQIAAASAYIIKKKQSIYGSRSSILESQLADALEMFYGGKTVGRATSLLQDAFDTRAEGGLDDLIWIKNNDLAVHHFLNKKFEECASIFHHINNMVEKNVIFMYRHGVCLEALASQPRFKNEKPKEWEESMRQAINLYECSLVILNKRNYFWSEDTKDKATSGGKFDPKSTLTIKMQLADAYFNVGEIKKSKTLWEEIKGYSPSRYEAEQKLRRLTANEGVKGKLATGIKALLTFSRKNYSNS